MTGHSIEGISALLIYIPFPGFALTTFCLSVFNTGVFIDKSVERMVLPLALFYGGIIQFSAGMWEIRTKNTFGAVAFASYGGFWMSFAAYVYYIAPVLATADDRHKAAGLFLFVSNLRFSILTAAFFFAYYSYRLHSRSRPHF